MSSIQWETRSIEPSGDGWIERRTGFHKTTGEDVKEERPVQHDGPAIFYVGRAAGDDARWEHVVEVKKERERERLRNEELPSSREASQALHDYAEQVVRESVGRRVFAVPDLPWKRSSNGRGKAGD